MLQPATLQFLRALKKNNNKEWFDKNRDKYEAAKKDFEEFVNKVLKNLSELDTTLGGLTPKDCTFRINRDIRFSKDKTPYKTNLAMYVAKGGKKTNHAGYYLHCEPGKAFIAGGAWMPMAEDLKKIRQEIDYNFADLQSILTAKAFKKDFEDLEKTSETSLTRAPKGYEDDNPAIAYLKLKSFITTKQISDEVLASKDFDKKVVSDCKTLKPLIDFLNQALDN